MLQPLTSVSFKSLSSSVQLRVDQVFEQLLHAEKDPPSRLHTSIRYSSLSAGKRIRPLLVYATGHLFDVKTEMLDIPAAAVEMVHVYSLIHDDLPAMDDDDLRRGKPTNHKAFDEATAILAGDALQAKAFKVLADPKLFQAPDEIRLKIISALSEAACGMVLGQAIDLASVGKVLTESELENMHLNKTGALIKASILLGAYCYPEVTSQQLKRLKDFADYIGLAFQVQDDILDIESDTETLGKNQGSDVAANKPTYPSILGMQAAKQKLNHLHSSAMNALAIFDEKADPLRELTDFIVKRTH